MHRRGGVWGRIEVRTADDERNLDQHDIAHPIGDIDREDDDANDDASPDYNANDGGSPADDAPSDDDDTRD